MDQAEKTKLVQARFNQFMQDLSVEADHETCVGAVVVIQWKDGMDTAATFQPGAPPVFYMKVLGKISQQFLMAIDQIKVQLNTQLIKNREKQH